MSRVLVVMEVSVMMVIFCDDGDDTGMTFGMEMFQ